MSRTRNAHYDNLLDRRDAELGAAYQQIDEQAAAIRQLEAENAELRALLAAEPTEVSDEEMQARAATEDAAAWRGVAGMQ